MEQLQDMFLLWVSTRSPKVVAAKFDCDMTTIHKIKKREQWAERLPDILERIRGRADNKAVSAVSKRVKVAMEIHDKVAEFLNQDDGDMEPTVGDFVKLSKYLDDVEGIGMETDKHDLIINIVNEIEQAGPDAGRRIAENALAGIGIIDPVAVSRLSKIFAGGLLSSN